MPRVRADQLVFERGLAESRERAKRLVMAGLVEIIEGGRRRRVDKPGAQLAPDAELALLQPERFVSRGAYKLLTAIDAFGIDPTGWVCLDAGASTGGFTDCLLQHGAAKVYAVDVGTSQLHERLRADQRVVSMEQTNLKHAGPELLPEAVDCVVADVSFISLTEILPACLAMLKPGGVLIALVKPQFELGPKAVVKGVVRDPDLQAAAVEKVRNFGESLGLATRGSVPAAIKGPKGNQEHLLYFAKM